MADPNFPIPGNPFAPSMGPMVPPAYSPIPMSAGGDPASMAMMLFGIPMLQRIAGPGHFVANMVPGQALADQVMAAQYQQSVRGATMAAASAGNAAVTTKIQGIASALVGGGESPLNREQAGNLAGFINNPIGKQLLGSMIGPDTLEGLMFGRQGDPAALAAAVNRVGFFRRDTLGGERMTAESLEDFSKSVHANLYGEGADIDAMRGFMGGQSAQMMEHLFQRGALPQSIGALTAAERVKIVSQSNRDDNTMNRLADEFGRRELMKADTKFDGRTFAEATEEEQRTILERVRPTYRKKLEDTLGRVDSYREADHRATSPEQMDKELAALEKIGGYDILARNVDASKTADKLKQFSGAVSAIREIFGDGGNPNAPMPQLLAALEHLSQGTMTQVGPAKVESTLRQMRIAARDAGIGFEQLAGMSQQIGAYGDTLGISRPVSMQNTLNAVMMTKAMRDAGAFNNPQFGRMSQAEAGMEAAMRMQRGDASGVGATLSAVARAVENNPDAYKSSPVLQEMAKAYRAGKETFTVGDKTYNIAEMAGMGGAQAITNFFAEQGGSVDTLRAYAIDPATQQYINPGYAYRTQRYQLQRDIGNEVLSGEVMDRINTKEFDDVAVGMGISRDRLTDEKYGFAKDFSVRMAKTIMEETGSMDPDKRAEYLRTRAPELLKSMFQKQGFNEVEAEKRANAFMPVLLGKTEAEQRDTLGRMGAYTSAFVYDRTGHGITGEEQLTGTHVMANLTREQAVSENRAKRVAAMSRGRETTYAQRIGEELERIGETGEFDMTRFVRSLGNTMERAGMRDDYAPELAAGFGAALKGFKNTTVNKSDILKAAEGARRGDRAALAQLKGMADVAADTEIVTEAQIAEKLKGKKDEEIAALYTRHVNGTATTREDRIAALAKSGGIAEEEGILDPKKKQKTVAQLELEAGGRIGEAKGGTPAEREKNTREAKRLERLVYAMQNADQGSDVEDSGRALADKVIEDKRLTGRAAEQTKAKFTAAAMGDAKALEEIKGTVSDDEYEQLRGLHRARKLATDETERLVLRDVGHNEKMGEVLSAEKKAEAEKLAEEIKKRDGDAKRAAGDTPADAAGTPAGGAGTPASGAETKPSETKISEARMRADNVTLVADAMTFSESHGGGVRGHPAAAAVEATVETARLAVTPMTGTGSNEITVNGTLQVRGMREAVLATVGDRPLDTGGVPIMNPHSYQTGQA